jgi:hypothetical protein
LPRNRERIAQIAGAFAQYEKARLVARLRRARELKKAEIGKCGGRKSHAEIAPSAVTLAKQLHRARTPTMSLRQIAAELARQGHLNRSGHRICDSRYVGWPDARSLTNPSSH